MNLNLQTRATPAPPPHLAATVWFGLSARLNAVQSFVTTQSQQIDSDDKTSNQGMTLNTEQSLENTRYDYEQKKNNSRRFSQEIWRLWSFCQIRANPEAPVR